MRVLSTVTVFGIFVRYYQYVKLMVIMVLKLNVCIGTICNQFSVDPMCLTFLSKVIKLHKYMTNLGAFSHELVLQCTIC